MNADDTASDVGRGELGEIDTDLGRGDANWQKWSVRWVQAESNQDREGLTGKTTDNSPDNEMSDVLGTALDGGPNDPDDTGYLQNTSSAHEITQPPGEKGADEATSRHRRGDAALGI